jgi:ABC-type Zn uptake system ZnuABC Zn-binding protein ZnuA
MSKILSPFWLALLFTVTVSYPAFSSQVLTSLGPIQSLTNDLLTNTTISVELVTGRPRAMDSLSVLLLKRAERYAEQFKAADVVVDIAKLWPEDPLYLAARQQNIRVVEIDATKPWSTAQDGIGVLPRPTSTLVTTQDKADSADLFVVPQRSASPYFWLSIPNILRSLDILARDLSALYPVAASTISTNLKASRERYLTLQRKTEQAMLELSDPQVFALSGDFVYLTNSLGLFVSGYSLDQESNWTPETLTKLTDTLEITGTKVIIHRWKPEDPILDAINAVGAKLIILDALETSTDLYTGMQKNYSLLIEALHQAE